MSIENSPTRSIKAPPSYNHSTPLTSHNTPVSSHIPPTSILALTLPTSDFPDSHLFVKNEVDILNSTPSVSNATTATSTSIETIPPQHTDSGTEVTPPPPSGKGKNGATGPAEGKSKPHLCHICGRGFTTGGHLQRHQRIHTGVKAFRCPFPGCDTKTSRQDNLQQHYRTHLSPSLRRGDGSQARAAVNAAMEAAGIKSVSTRAPRKSKNSNSGTTPSSAAGSLSHLPSPYQTPTSQGPNPYTPYMYDPGQHAYSGYPLPPPQAQMMHPHQGQSATSSRVPSPVNGGHPQSAGGNPAVMPTPPHYHQQQYYSQPFPPYGYPAAIPHLPHQAYRHFPGMNNPYAPQHPHHPMYSPGGMQSEHSHHMYSPMQNPFPTHSREGSYNGMMTPGYGGQSHGPMANGNGYPNRTQSSTPISQEHGHESGKAGGEMSLSAYSRGHRPLSPGLPGVGVGNGHHVSHVSHVSHGSGDGVGLGIHRSGGSRRTPPHHDMMPEGVDPSSMNRSVHPGIIHNNYGYHNTQQSPQHHMSGGGYYGTPQSGHQLGGRHHASALSQRASISSLSDGSGGGEESQKGDFGNMLASPVGRVGRAPR